MDEFLENHPDEFRTYAMRDALITLIHAVHMERISFGLGRPTIPITLAGLSSLYIKNKWDSVGYKGYQLNNSYLLGEPNEMLTPKGLYNVGDVGLVMGYYINSYKGGRNESFMYGKDENSKTI